MSSELQDKIAKLPKWVQDEMKKLRLERDAAVNALNRFTDDQTPTGIWVEEHPCTGEKPGPSFKRRYINAHKVDFECGGVHLSVRFDEDSERIDLSYCEGADYTGEVAMLVKSFNRVVLSTKGNIQ